MYYLLFYEAVDDYVQRRVPYREAHLAHARASYERGDLVMAGPFTDPADGAVLIFKADSPAVAEDFARQDPYVQAGLIKAWRVRAWKVVFGG